MKESPCHRIPFSWLYQPDYRTMSDSIRLLFHKAGYLVENVSGKALPVYGPGKNNLWDNAKEQ